MGYIYYGLSRPLTIGCFPIKENNRIIRVYNFGTKKYIEELGRDVWGYIEYEMPLSYFDVLDYELEAKKTETLHLRYMGTDSWGRYVYIDENKKLWKHLNCCIPREACIELGDALYSSCNNCLDGEPDCHMSPHIKAEFIE